MTEIQELTDDELTECLERLTLHAAQKFYSYGWKGSSKKNERIGPRAKSPQDIASETIISFIQGDRSYNPEAYPDFMAFLRSAVDSQIYNLSKLVEHKIKKPLTQETNEKADNPTSTEFSGTVPGPLRICISKELVEKLKTSLSLVFNKDELVREIFECMEAGVTKRREIAELLGVKVKEVDNARKRLYRRISRISL